MRTQNGHQYRKEPHERKHERNRMKENMKGTAWPRKVTAMQKKLYLAYHVRCIVALYQTTGADYRTEPQNTA